MDRRISERVVLRWDGAAWVTRALSELTVAGDPDGPLVPLPVRHVPERVVPLFPLTAYEVLTR